jgi:AcrR family transcriptional regulator
MPSHREGAEAARSARSGISNNGVSAAGRARVEGIQRARLVAAMVEVAAERGLADATVARVVARAGVSRRTFYELFEDREDCFLAAFDEGIARASRYLLDAYDPNARWAERIRTALTALLSFLDVERGVGQLLLVGSLGAGTNALERRQRVLAQIITAIDEGRTEARGGSELPPLTAEGVVGGALSVIHARLLACLPPAMGGPRMGDPGPGRLVELAGPLMSMIVLPYLGPVAARRELERLVPKPRAAAERAGGDPLRELEMRLTYRTVRVLMSVAVTPGSSNREVGVAAGIADQGQISKLLGRLQGLGLVQNDGLAPGKGAPNAWTLTAKGLEVERAMSVDNGQPRVEASRRSRR